MFTASQQALVTAKLIMLATIRCGRDMMRQQDYCRVLPFYVPFCCDRIRAYSLLTYCGHASKIMTRSQAKENFAQNEQYSFRIAHVCGNNALQPDRSAACFTCSSEACHRSPTAAPAAAPAACAALQGHRWHRQKRRLRLVAGAKLLSFPRCFLRKSRSPLRFGSQRDFVLDVFKAPH